MVGLLEEECESVKFLSYILYGKLTDANISELASHTLDENIQDILESKEVDKICKFLKIMVKHFEKDWKSQLLLDVEQLFPACKTLIEFLDFYINKRDEEESLKWLWLSWKDLLEMEDVVKELLKTFHQKEISEDWFVEFFHFACFSSMGREELQHIRQHVVHLPLREAIMQSQPMDVECEENNKPPGQTRDPMSNEPTKSNKKRQTEEGTFEENGKVKKCRVSDASGDQNHSSIDLPAHDVDNESVNSCAFLQQDRNLAYYKKLAMEEKYSLEYRAVLADGLPDNGQLMLYILDIDESMPMTYKEKSNTYIFMREVSNNKYNETYKFWIARQSEKVWEAFPGYDFGGKCNRCRCINEKERSSGRVVLFDVVITAKEDQDDYRKTVERNLPRLLPCWNDISLNETNANEDATTALLITYERWVDSYVLGVSVKDEFAYRMVIRLQPILEKSLKDHISHETSHLEQTNGLYCHIKRVVGIFIVGLVMTKSNFDLSESLKVMMCDGISLHDVKPECLPLLSKELFKITSYLNSGKRKNWTRSSKEIVGNMFFKLKDVPKCLLVLPLLKLLQKVSDEPTQKDEQPTMPYRCGWNNLRSTLRQTLHQEALEKLSEKVCLLSQSFSWIWKLYIETLSLQTVSKVLSSDTPSILDIKDIFPKLKYFWTEAAKKFSSEDISEESMVVLHSFLMEKLEMRIKVSEAKRNETNVKTDDEIQRLIEANELLDVLMKYVKTDAPKLVDLIAYSFQFMNRVMEYAHMTASQLNGDEELNRKIAKFHEKLEKAASAMMKAHPRQLKNTCVTLWNSILEIEWYDKELCKSWREEALNSILKVLPVKFGNDIEKLLIFFANDLESMKPNKDVLECFTEVVTKEVESQLQKEKSTLRKILRSVQTRFPMSSGLFQSNFVKIFSRILEDQWSEFPFDEESDLLQFLANWNPTFLRIICENGLKQQLSPYMLSVIKKMEGLMNSLIQHLYDGSILVSQLHKLKDVKRVFWDCYAVLQQSKKSSSVDSNVSVSILSDIIQARSIQLESFTMFRESLQMFCEFIKSSCEDSITIDFCGLQERLLIDFSNISLNKLVFCREFIKLKRLPENPAIIFFQLPENHLNALLQIHSTKAIQSNKVKQNMKELLNAAFQAGIHQMTIFEVVDRMWMPTSQAVEDIVRAVELGTLTLQAVEELFKQSISNNTVDLPLVKQELKILYGIYSASAKKQGSCFTKRFNQIENYFTLRHNIKSAEVLDKIRVMLELDGEFNELADPLKIGKETGKEPLLSMNKNVIRMAKTLGEVKQEELKSLITFSNCENLVTWLKTNMKTIGDVKVMSDLAMILAGETPMEVDRVSYFLSAVMGFSPLIFGLSSQSGFAELLDACKEVWANVKRDQDLLKKWEETSKHLLWLDLVKDFHGSVEKSSLTRAQMINNEGAYEVHCGDDSVPVLENSIRLYLFQPVKDNVVMSLNDLRDLQSRLMLIAGEADKGKQDVNRFIDVLASVENLAKVYVKLKTAGCSLFTGWRSTVRCKEKVKEDGDRNVTVEVYFDESSPVISSSKDVIEELANLTRVLSEAHEQWIAYLTDKRNDHYHLNHFKIYQLTYLCQQLATCQVQNLPDQVYALLSSVAENVTAEKIRDYLDEATKVNDDFASQHGDEETLSDEEMLSDIERKKRVVRKLVKMELSENVAKAAVQAVESLDVDECYLWALTTGDQYIQKLQQQFDENIGFETKEANIKAIQNIVNDRSNLTLKEVINQIQYDLDQRESESMATTVKTVCERYFKGTAVTSLDDCISLEHLGQFLQMLGAAAAFDSVPQRKWQDHFSSGKPNLIVCRKSEDMWCTLLSLYVNSPEEPLPSASEVLICSECTSSEEVELLLRRAIGQPVDKGKRIYCLACADELPFNVAKETEEKFQQLIQLNNKNEDYHLVILTSSLQHYISSCFDEHKVDGTYCSADITIEDYLKRRLCRKQVLQTAAAVDFESSSVRVVRSDRAGMGKSLYISRRRHYLSRLFHNSVNWKTSVVRLLEKNVDIDDVVASLIDHGNTLNEDLHFVHIDVTPSVHYGVGKMLFDLVVLGKLTDSRGFVWRHRLEHFYAIEYSSAIAEKGDTFFTKLLELLPTVRCLSPLEVRNRIRNYEEAPTIEEVLMDDGLLMHEMYQRPYQYLMLYANQENLDNFIYTEPRRNVVECLDNLLRYCSISDPSWSELSHFAKFLDTQLRDCERSVFCDLETVGADSGLTGFKQFVVRFMIRMSQDFATPSLNVVDEEDTIGEEEEVEEDNENVENDIFELHQLRRRWESGFHPYLFFNDDRVSMSFVHFNVSAEGDLCHPKTNEVVEKNLMPVSLVQGLEQNGVQLHQDFDQLSRCDKLTCLCKIFGVEVVFDPDPTYELTTDNVLKMLAIHMRFRCGIPVVVMGETGCGKTRMVEFMSKLKAGGVEDIQNMWVVKVHGGITVSVIQERVRESIELAKYNKASGNGDTLLFLDEANTTEAIYAIKEIVCDGTVHGEPFLDAGLKIVAACNPYKAHSPKVITNMEQAGLGFHVDTEDALETFAGIPMRKLVYRVISLPPSMQPLVWDFGQLNNDTEAIYIRLMVDKLKEDINNTENVPNLPDDMTVTISSALAASQVYMRQRHDVCSFVSLRDVERTIQSFKWFYGKLVDLNPMIKREKDQRRLPRLNISYGVRALIEALGMCYHVTLQDRTGYRTMLAKQITETTRVVISEKDILNEIIACQNIFINEIKLDRDIARNEALRENVFMMVVCAEMRIPLFLVGKPGSSKSLAKTIVTDAMQGRNSGSHLFRQLKEIHVLSFQCSAVSDAVGIEAVFTQCAQLQKERDLNKYVATVVLDEIGLAEDSKKMPLKVLHPLLEHASTKSHTVVEPYHKVGFVGISNWALDPAKMNRGIFVTRAEPTKEDLVKTANAIFESDEFKLQVASGVIDAVTNAYMEIYKKENNRSKEFFGLRDYYALLKMLFAKVSQNKKLNFVDIATAAMRNFSGYSEDVLPVFQRHCIKCFADVQLPCIPVTKLIHSNLNAEEESRFLLLLTKQYSAVSLLREVMGNIKNYQVIFGSSFPHDHDYTEMCRNINRIKVCMETGRAVVLLNLRDLYESLYDALNQHYVTFAMQRYVDLGLGGHRVKCRIAKGFRLIVIEEKETVYNEFPIPLINRLEKYVFEITSVLTPNERNVVNQLKDWIKRFSKIDLPRYQRQRFTEENAFIGYKEDTAASALLSAAATGMDCFENSQKILLQTASLDGICRLQKSDLRTDSETLMQIYMLHQVHDTLWVLLKEELRKPNLISVFEISSFSQVLNERDRKELQHVLHLSGKQIMLLTLQQFQTEQEYAGRLIEFFEFIKSRHTFLDQGCKTQQFVLLIQCPHADVNGNLIACAKYSAMNKLEEFKKGSPDLQCNLVVCFLFTLERRSAAQKRTASFTSFHSQDCTSVYIDELRPKREHISVVSKLWDKTISDILSSAMENAGSDDVILDIERLLLESIPEAMAKLRNQTKTQQKNRVQLLTTLSCKTELSRPFLGILLKQILSISQDREVKLDNKEQWIVEEACSAQSLQEGGSFRNALWLRLRRVVALALAKIVSIADADNNLELIANLEGSNHLFVNLWFEIFDSARILDFQWSSGLQSATLPVPGKFCFTCQFPFVRAIYDIMNAEWRLAQEGHAQDKEIAFAEKMAASPLQGVLDSAERLGMVAIERFAHDLVHLMYKSQISRDMRIDELKVIQACIVESFKAKRKRPKAQNYNAMVEIFVLIKGAAKSLLHFSEVIATCPDILNEGQNWKNEQENSTVFVAHRCAFISLIDKLQREAKDSFGTIATCNRWKACVVKTKQFVEKLLPMADADTAKHWKRIVFVEIFLNQLVPASCSDAATIRYLAPLSRHARLLWVGTSKIKDLSSLQFLKIVMKTLQSCHKEIQVRLLCSWNEVKCKACKADKLLDPVLLPCNHYICLRCVSQKPDSSCPICRRKIVQPRHVKRLEFTDNQTKEMESFKSACTSFFLEYLSTVCFPPLTNNERNYRSQPMDDKVYLALEELVIFDNKTKQLSPLLGNLDTNPTARSYILQLLLRYDPTLVEHQLENHFKKMGLIFQNRSILMGIYIQCKQDVLQNQSFIDDNGENDFNVEFSHILLQECMALLTDRDNRSQIRQLDLCSKLQFVAKVSASCLYSLGKHQDDNKLENSPTMPRFVRFVCKTLSEPRFLIIRQFIIKNLCMRFGMDAFNVLLRDDTFKMIIPHNLMPAHDAANEDFYLQSDLFALSGEVYVKIKAMLLDIAQEDDIPPVLTDIGNEILHSRDTRMQAFLALSVWASHSHERNGTRQEIFTQVLKQSQPNLCTEAITKFFVGVAQGSLNVLKCPQASPQVQYKLTELIILIGSCILGNQNILLRDFSVLTENPEQFLQMYLPAMPDSNYAAVRQAIASSEGGPKMHLCPNGHPYYIGECTRPIQVGKCVECGAEIGGRGHALLVGNRAGEMREESQAGYKLKNSNIESPAVHERRLTKLSVCATRVCLHSVMVLSALNEKDVARLINIRGGQNEVFTFLLQHILKDLEELSKCLGRSIDDAFIIMHQIFHRGKHEPVVVQQQHHLQTMAAREAWEEEFQRLYLAPVFTATTEVIAQAQEILIDAGKLGERPLERLVYELKQEDDMPQGIVKWDSPNLWKYRIHADKQHLRQTLEAIDFTSNGAALKVIINAENLDVLCHLHKIISLQSAVIARYWQKIDMADADEISLQEFLADGNYVFEDSVNLYNQLWNKMRHFQLNAGRHNVPLSYLDDDMNLDSPISMCLPSRRGRGLCALLMVYHLVDKQNNLLHQLRELISPPPRFETVDVADLIGKDVVCVNDQIDLLPLIQENSQYEATVVNGGPRHNISYNLDLLQKKIIEKCFVGKSFIQGETVPLMQYPQDMGLAKDYDAVKTQHEQIVLPPKMCQSVDASVDEAMTANICEAVRTLSLVIQFLAKGSKAQIDQTICDYAQTELLLPPEETEMIPRSAQIRHCLALYERLSWHRSRRLIENGQNPFENAIEGAKNIEAEEVVKSLERELAQMNINRLQLELNALIMVGPEVEPNWRLGADVLRPYLDGKHEADNSWCEKIPEEILFMNAVHVFNLSMEITTKG